jgi:hypothetical protein
MVNYPTAGPKIENLGTIEAPCAATAPGEPADCEERARLGENTYRNIWFWDIGGFPLTANDVQPFSTYPDAANDVWTVIDRNATSPQPPFYSDYWLADYMFTDVSFCHGDWTKEFGYNRIQDPQLGHYGEGTYCANGVGAGLLDPRPVAGSPVVGYAELDDMNAYDPWFVDVNYAGAFEPAPAEMWINCWTFVYCGGYVPQVTCTPCVTDLNCGDADGNDIINISDAVFLISYIFGGGPAPDPLLLGDADGNCIVNISDAVYLISYIFGGGPAPICGDC